MYDREISHRQLTAWLTAAIIPTAIQILSGASWVSVLLVNTLCLLCVFLRWRFGKEPQVKLLSLLQWALLTVVLGTACQSAAQCWPEGEHSAVAIVLLLLALWSAWKGPSSCARVGSVLFCFVLFLYLILLGAGVKDIQTRWLVPVNGDANAFGCVLLLTPAAAAIHLKKRKQVQPRLLLIGVFSVVAAAVTVGVLSPQVAANKENAFYEMTRSLNLLGRARRFEAVLSAGMTAGWFTLISLFLTMCAGQAEIFHPGWSKKGLISAAVISSGILLYDLHIPGVLLLILTAVFWVLLPVLTQGVDLIKKS